MKPKLVAAGVALVAAAGLCLAGEPTLDEQAARLPAALQQKLASRQVYIDPGELLDTIYNNNVGVRIFDLRNEVDYNLFHIMDAQRISLEQLHDRDFIKALPEDTVFVLVSNGEARATRAWKLLAVQKVSNIFVLEGGINHWLEVYGPRRLVETAGPCPDGECRRYFFSAALGDRHPEADPGPHQVGARKYQKKIKGLGGKVRKSGGCG